MYHLKNLSSEAIKQEILPWNWKLPGEIPEGVRKNKKLRDQWMTNPKTDWYCYNFNEGINAGLRVSELKKGSGNPIRAIQGFVGDYDSSQSVEKALAYAKEMTYPPNRLEHTLSGNWRAVWWIEGELLCPSNGFYKFFMEHFADFAFDVGRMMPGFDKGAWKNPTQYYTNSGEWYALHDNEIPADVLQGWLVKTGLKFKWSEQDFGTAIPLDLVREGLTKKYPRFAQWDGEFALGAQSISFWIPDSASPKSATVRESGLQTFSAHAIKGFYSWSELLGSDFVKEFEARTIGKAVSEVYFDSKWYWTQNSAGVWQNYDDSRIGRVLQVGRKLPTSSDPEGVSLFKRALHHIEDLQRIEAAGSIPFRPSGVFWKHGQRYLNTTTVKIMQPAEGPVTWGPEGEFPWLCKLFDIFLGEEAQLIVRAWTAYAYRNAFLGDPQPGQVLFIAGPVNVGKTLFCRGLLAALFGGFAEAGAMLMKADNFNSEMFKAGVWCVDDATAGADVKVMRMFTEMLKAVAANPEFRCNEKFLKAMLIEWFGRLTVTCNVDRESIRMMPELGLSNRDKLILVRTVDGKGSTAMEFPPRSEITRLIQTQGPYLARYFLDWEIPKELLGSARYGIREYADPSLVELSQQASTTSEFLQMFLAWRQTYFGHGGEGDQASYWEGNEIEFLQLLESANLPFGVIRNYNGSVVGRRLGQLAANFPKLGLEKLSGGGDSGVATWRIEKKGIE